MLSRFNRSAVEEVQIDGELCAIIISAEYDDLGFSSSPPTNSPSKLHPCRILPGRSSLPTHIIQSVVKCSTPKRLCSSERENCASTSIRKSRNTEPAACLAQVTSSCSFAEAMASRCSKI